MEVGQKLCEIDTEGKASEGRRTTRPFLIWIGGKAVPSSALKESEAPSEPSEPEQKKQQEQVSSEGPSSQKQPPVESQEQQPPPRVEKPTGTQSQPAPKKEQSFPAPITAGAPGNREERRVCCSQFSFIDVR